MDWRLVTEFFTSVGYGLLSSFVPVFNSEVYIVAAQALGLSAEVTVAVGVAIGQTIGKTAIVLALRNGTRIPWLQRQVDALRSRSAARDDELAPGRFKLAYRRWSARLLDLIGHSHWGPAIIFLSGTTGIPPVFAIQFIVPATRMPAWVFALSLLLGRCVLFLAVAFGASAIIAQLFH